MRALFAGPGALRRLRAGGRGEIVVAGRAGAYARIGDGHLHVCAVGGAFGPLTVAVRGELDLRAGAEVVAGDGELRIGGERISLDRVRPRGRTLPVIPSPARNADMELPPLPSSLVAGVRALETGDLPAAVAELAGRGRGLTPDGDDVLAGYAAWRYAVGEPVRLPAEGLASPIGLSYLRCAERGELPEAAADVLAALLVGARPASLPALLRWGASSGAALAHGMTAGTRRVGRRDDGSRAHPPRAACTPPCPATPGG